MAISNDTQPEAPTGAKPLHYVTLQGFPTVTVTAFACANGVSFDYSGSPEDLAALGVMRPEWMTPTRKHLRDPDGGKVSISRRWRTADNGHPSRYCVVRRLRQFEVIARWPGVPEALEAHQVYCAWRWPPPPVAESAKPSRPALRLIVDNTRVLQ